MNVKLQLFRSIKESRTQSVRPRYTWNSEGYADLTHTEYLLSLTLFNTRGKSNATKIGELPELPTSINIGQATTVVI